VNQAIDALTQQKQHSPTIVEIAGYLGVTTDDVLAALETSEAYNFVSLEGDRNVDGSDSFSILEYIGEDDRLMALVDDRTTLAEALRVLTPQEQQVLYLRFFQGLTQTEIAVTLGISQMQVSRLLRKTLRALREHIVMEEL
jgi:RNA polymerase sigma-B factor